MSEEEVEIVPDDQEDVNVYLTYFERIELPELRRFVALDMARVAGAMPDKLVKHGREIERFLAGNLPELARSNDN